MKDGCCCNLRGRLVRENYIDPRATLLSWDLVMEDYTPSTINFLPPKSDKDKTTVELMQEVILVVRKGSERFNRRRKMMYDDRTTTE